MTSQQYNKMQIWHYYNNVEDQKLNENILHGENLILALLPESDIEKITLWMKVSRPLQAPKFLLS